MFSPTSSPLPFLPTEVKKEILKFCDQATLAKTSSLSLAFLQLSSPLLYRHIEFEGPKGLTKFLTLVAEKRHPELEPWLDLSLVHSIAYIDVKDDPFHPFPVDEEDEDAPFVTARLSLPSSSTPGHLSLHSLKVVLSADESRTRLYPFFNPLALGINGTMIRLGPSFVSFDVSLWTRLRSVVFVNAFFTRDLLACGFGQMSLEAKLTVSYDLSSPEHALQNEEWLDQDLSVGAQRLDEAAPIQSFVVLVGSEDYKAELLENFADSALLPRMTVLVKSSNETAAIDVDSA